MYTYKGRSHNSLARYHFLFFVERVTAHVAIGAEPYLESTERNLPGRKQKN